MTFFCKKSSKKIFERPYVFGVPKFIKLFSKLFFSYTIWSFVWRIFFQIAGFFFKISDGIVVRKILPKAPCCWIFVVRERQKSDWFWVFSKLKLSFYPKPVAGFFFIKDSIGRFFIEGLILYIPAETWENEIAKIFLSYWSFTICERTLFSETARWTFSIKLPYPNNSLEKSYWKKPFWVAFHALKIS